MAPDAQARDCFVDSPRLHVYKSGSSHRLGSMYPAAGDADRFNDCLFADRLNPAPTDYDPKLLGRSPSFSFGSRTKLPDTVIPTTPAPSATHGSFEMKGPKFSGLDYKNSVIAAHSKARASKPSIPRWLDDPSFVAGAANSNNDVIAYGLSLVAWLCHTFATGQETQKLLKNHKNLHAKSLSKLQSCMWSSAHSAIHVTQGLSPRLMPARSPHQGKRR